jgi:hypothetical protein
MKTALTLLIVILFGAALIYLGGGSTFVDIRRAIPFFGGYAPGWWDFAALALIVFAVVRIGRMVRGPRESVEEENEPEDTDREDSVDEGADQDHDDAGADEAVDGEEDTDER